jgi:hypothetical protein
VAAERDALAAYLEYYRATVDMKCRGLTPEQARTRSMPPSTLSLHGLVRHLAGIRMITEYAQHCGHADLLREGVDGKTGA